VGVTGRRAAAAGTGRTSSPRLTQSTKPGSPEAAAAAAVGVEADVALTTEDKAVSCSK
jgi:hypothetical protein